jgi:hypothetical protein
VISKQQWDIFSTGVRDQMAAHVAPYSTPIAYSEPGTGRANIQGTGSYFAFLGRAYVLTNAHVAQPGAAYLAHLLGPTDDYVGFTRQWKLERWPVDVALNQIGAIEGDANGPVITPANMDVRYGPIQHELLFWLGYPGSTAIRHEPVTDLNVRYNWFGGPLESRAVPILVQAVPDNLGPLDSFDVSIHVALHYPSSALQKVGEQLQDLPNPKGMSGSLLWDTKAVACEMSGVSWSPARARVCGILWGAHSKPEVVVATRIEHVRATLLQFLREERAYAHWEARGQPFGDAMTDWEWAEQELADLV